MPKYNKCPKHNEMDLYPVCSFNCIYCISQDNKDKIKHLPDSSIDNYINEADKALPFYLSPWTDCYPPMESQSGRTRKVLSQLRSKGCSYFVITKSTLVHRDIDMFENNDKAFIAISLNTLDDTLTDLFEPDVPSATERKEMIENMVGKNNCKLVIKIDPVIPGVTDGKKLMDLLEWIKKVKPYAVTSETLRVSKPILSNMSNYLPASILNTIKTYYNTPGDTAEHPDMNYRLKVFNTIDKNLSAAGIRACFCKATIDEPINALDCRGGYN